MTADDPIIAYAGEVQLMNWGDTSTRGRTITLQLPDEGDSHPFSTARTKQGKKAGQRYQIVMVELGDIDDQPVEKTPSQMAFLLCQDKEFQHWLNERSFAPIKDEDSARAHICEGCGVKSRSELDKDPNARMAWLEQFFNPWTSYRSNLHKVL